MWCRSSITVDLSRAAEPGRVAHGRLEEIGTNFGTFDNYLTTGLGLSNDTIATLKTKLTA
ncbi:tyrosine phosphatase C-terminal region family protein [Rhodococcus sp. MTM3W5.2]|uniref:tyrosine-protein phosphatase n=1 Tax=Rhodococcus sp. MTM3W5.2 TaxID=1805827 RepID=UPI0009794220|nr:tyrosine phosphatase C-terminal region family protein [Rhodococcus sp. MTM3W5.2]